MDFYKYHALGNDYIVIDPKENKIKLDGEKIKLICHRNFGVGSDGILYGPLFKGKNLSLKIFNPDGSEAEKSGNGLRIFARFLFDAGYIKNNFFLLHTKGGEVKVEILDRTSHMIKVDMGTVTFQSKEIPVAGESREVVNEMLQLGDNAFKVICLSIGNPHCVIILDEISDSLAKKIGPLVENHPLFPNRINMQLVKVVDRHNIQIEIWERGAGYTLASGSSSCAAASAVFKLGLVESQLNVHMPGGVLDIEIDRQGHVHMAGPVSSVACGDFSPEFKKKLK
ncbi:MAG: diaminopimelate epimerase [Spirochaetes bacterium]|nr:diaminopimelate epimerase [Spirochaetota bacterium]